uniref:Rieske domain-containing protein n=1 Tax=Odontella aurita TaxID=265563 RepID=A0A7S4MQM6_9STRA
MGRPLGRSSMLRRGVACSCVLAAVRRRGATTVTAFGGFNGGAVAPLRRSPPSSAAAAAPRSPLFSVSSPHTAAAAAAAAANDLERIGIPKEISEEQDGGGDLFSWERQWYPAFPLEALGDDGSDGKGGLSDMPHACKILGRNIVVWRSGTSEDGKAPSYSALDDTCPHRKTALSTGKIVSGDGGAGGGERCGKSLLQCRMHGWKFGPDGSCVDVPMMATEPSSSDRNALGAASSYPTKVAGEMLWIFMDPTVPESDLPELPAGAAFEPDDDKNWVHVFNLNPLSYEVMVENTFDPSHAPFVHEGATIQGGGAYSPDEAIPMKRFELVGGDMGAQSGFTVRHTPYREAKGGGARADSYKATTTRQFIPPCTTVTRGTVPDSEIRISFVPASKRETRVIFSFGIPVPKNRLVASLVKRALNNDFLHTMQQMSEGRTKFLDQDRLTMQLQDERRMLDGAGTDLRPTSSDAGVAAFQRWIGRCGNGGPFADAPATPNAGAFSMWDTHGRHCARCKRTLGRLARVERRAARASAASLLLGVAVGMAALLMERVGASARAAAAALLVGSFVARKVRFWCADMQAKMFVSTGPKREIQEVYLYQ